MDFGPLICVLGGEKGGCQTKQLDFSRQEVCVRWLGLLDMLRSRVVPEVHRFAWMDKPPYVLILHVGRNDLGLRSMLDIMRDVKFDLLRLRMSYPDMIIVWLDMVARTSWRMARSVEDVNRARRKMNRDISKFVVRNGDLGIRHLELEVETWRYWRGDGVHLKDIGTEMWALGIQDGAQRA